MRVEYELPLDIRVKVILLVVMINDLLTRERLINSFSPLFGSVAFAPLYVWPAEATILFPATSFPPCISGMTRNEGENICYSRVQLINHVPFTPFPSRPIESVKHDGMFWFYISDCSWVV